MIGNFFHHLRRRGHAPRSARGRLDDVLRHAVREEAEECHAPATLPAFTEGIWARIERATLPTYVDEKGATSAISDRRVRPASASGHSRKVGPSTPAEALARRAAWPGRMAPIGFAGAAVLLVAAILGRWGAPGVHRGDVGVPPTRMASRPDGEPVAMRPKPAPSRQEPDRSASTAARPAVTSSVLRAMPWASQLPSGAGTAQGAQGRPVASLHQPLRAPSHEDLGTTYGRATGRPGDDERAIEDQVRRAVRVWDDFVRVPFPRLASASDRQIAAAVESYRREAAVVDARLAREVTLQQKATALSDLCDGLRSETGIQLTAGQSVADEKVTVFCRKMPLREVMRQLGRPFGYTWLRSGRAGEYRYELVQDLRSQLLEEELRNRDRNEALLALEREIERYRPYLSLTPDEALARSKTAPASEKRLLEALAGTGWGPIHMYYRLSRRDLEALRAGEGLTFRQDPKPGEALLPAEMARGVLESTRHFRVVKGENGYGIAHDSADPRSVALTTVPELRAQMMVSMPQSELGQFTLSGNAGFNNPQVGESLFTQSINPLAVGMSPSVLKPENGATNAKLAQDSALRQRVTVQPQPTCRPAPSPAQTSDTATPTTGGNAPEPKVTSADVLEALHRATGMPIVSDYYTHLYKPDIVSVRNRPLFDALNDLADTMHLHWSRDAEARWLQFRSTGFFNDRLKEVPNRLLMRWAAARRQHGAATLDDLCEIAQLSDAQLNAADMAEGARLCWGLEEWDLGRNGNLRKHLRYLAGFTPAQREEALGPTGLPFARMPLAQQQQFITFALEYADDPLQSLDDLAGSTLRVEYTLPGRFQWGAPTAWGYTRWVVPLEAGPRGKRVLRPPVQERTREAAVEALHRIDPKIREALLQSMRRGDPRVDAAPPDDEAQIVPTRLNLTVLYVPGDTNARTIHVICPDYDFVHGL
jgi:hypothetical protein